MIQRTLSDTEAATIIPIRMSYQRKIRLCHSPRRIHQWRSQHTVFSHRAYLVIALVRSMLIATMFLISDVTPSRQLLSSPSMSSSSIKYSHITLGRIDPADALEELSFKIAQLLRNRKRKDMIDSSQHPTIGSKPLQSTDEIGDEAPLSPTINKDQLCRYAGKACVPHFIWEQLTGEVFLRPQVIHDLVQTGLQVVYNNRNDCTGGAGGNELSPLQPWKPNQHTHQILKEHSKPSQEQQQSILENDVLVWTTQFVQKNIDNENENQNNGRYGGASTTCSCYGCHVPCVKTRGIINHLSPLAMAKLLMNSSYVKLYNKMSLGRLDLYILQAVHERPQGGAKYGDEGSQKSPQQVTPTSRGGGGRVVEAIGVDGKFGDEDEVGQYHGETKIVKNRTKPPLTKHKLEFITLMHSRKLSNDKYKIESQEDAGWNGSTSIDLDGAYLVVSRAVRDVPKTKVIAPPASKSEATTIDKPDTDDDEYDDDATKMIRSEIILGINLLRRVPDQPNKTDFTSVSHVYSPAVPLMFAKKVGMKGAVDFINDIRALAAYGTISNDELLRSH